MVLRILMGLLLCYASLAYFFPSLQGGGEHPAPTEAMKTYMSGMETVYLMKIVKVLEFFIGILLLVGRYVTFANILLFPITLNICMFHAVLQPEDIGAGVFLLVGNIVLFYRYWNHYKSLLTP